MVFGSLWVKEMCSVESSVEVLAKTSQAQALGGPELPISGTGVVK